MKAVLFISHGSRLSQTTEEVRHFVRQLERKSAIPIFEYAFLEVAYPSIPEGIAACVTKGATEIIILLNFLNTGRHVDEDIPGIIGKARLTYPDVGFYITKPVGQHDQILSLFLDMINQYNK
jgi:sirohydrochlorin ferrochelatase